MVRILVVDDDPMLRRIAALALGRSGFEVVVAASGEEAIAIVAEDPLPALALLDQSMPGLDGTSTLARLRSDPRTAALPVAMWTADPEDRALVARCEALGVRAILAKPFDPRALAARVAELLTP